MSQISYSKYKYNPDEISEKEFLEKFVVRIEIFDDIFEDIIDTDYSVSNQHYIIVGQRGQGKTSLLRKIQIEVQNDKKLSKFLLPVKFTEEQYQIRTLCRLWEEVAEYLQDLYEDEFGTILDYMEEHFDDDDYDLRCFNYLEEKIKDKDKKVLLLIDNIDELLGKLKEKEQRQLREILITSSTFRIIGGSTKMLEQHYDYNKPFYEFFKIINLTGLNYDESIKFLRMISEEDQKHKIEKIIKDSPARIEALRQLTGGVPRTLVMLLDIFIEDDGNAFEDLLKILDDVTPLYKDRMDALPAVLQDIVHNIAMHWDGITTKELAKKTKIESKAVSSQLKQLEKYHIIESDSIGKNKIYKIQERFFNIWYLMRFGRKKDRSKVEWLVRFLLSWYSKDELEDRVQKFMSSIKNKDLNESYVYHMCEALSYTGLDIRTEYKLKKQVRIYLDKNSSKFAKELSPSDKELLEKVFVLIDKKENNNAISLLKKSKKHGKEILFVLGYLYYEQKEYKKAEEYYLKAIDSEDNGALNNLGILYQKQKEYKKGEEYYLKAIDSGDNGTLKNLGILYAEQKEYKKAEEYYLKAIESGDDDALNSLSWFYFEQIKNQKKALKLVQDSYNNKKNYYNTHTLSIILLWSEEFGKSYEKFSEWLDYDNAIDSTNDVTIYLNLLIAKEQLYKAKELFEISKYQLKDRFKPIWYALMQHMEKEFPYEIKKMGSELKQSVDDVLKEIEELKVKYKV